MRHKMGGRKFSRATAFRLAMYDNLVTDLLRHGKITTTEAKAKEIRMMAEKVITLGKDGTLVARRHAQETVKDQEVLRKVFNEYNTRFASRTGGYTRVLKIGPRKGDGAPMALLELVE